jgi:hypothetical protein
MRMISMPGPEPRRTCSAPAAFGELDLDHLTLEIEDVGGALKRAARKRIRMIIEHLLKLEHAPASEPRAGWRATVRTQRVRLRDTLTPTLRREVEQELAELYEDARGLRRRVSRPWRGRRRRSTAPDRSYSFDQLTGTWLPK